MNAAFVHHSERPTLEMVAYWRGLNQVRGFETLCLAANNRIQALQKRVVKESMRLIRLRTKYVRALRRLDQIEDNRK